MMGVTTLGELTAARIVFLSLVTAAVCPAAFAQDRSTSSTAAPAAVPRTATVTAGVELPMLSGYVFRGIVQEYDPALTVQPFVDVQVPVSDRLTVGFGTWNSLHTGSLKENIGMFYEARLRASVSYRTGRVESSVQYALYASPAGGYDVSRPGGSIGVSEVSVSTRVDDRGSWLPIHPHALVAFETTETQADFGRAKGVYVEVGVRPTFAATWLPARVVVPMRIGLSGKDYRTTSRRSTASSTATTGSAMRRSACRRSGRCAGSGRATGKPTAAYTCSSLARLAAFSRQATWILWRSSRWSALACREPSRARAREVGAIALNVWARSEAPGTNAPVL